MSTAIPPIPVHKSLGNVTCHSSHQVDSISFPGFLSCHQMWKKWHNVPFKPRPQGTLQLPLQLFAAVRTACKEVRTSLLKNKKPRAERVQLTAGTNNVSDAILDDAVTVRSPDDYSCVTDAGKTSWAQTNRYSSEPWAKKQQKRVVVLSHSVLGGTFTQC